jgi:hypothetical protein
VITRNNGADIFCGLARCYQFKPINEIGNTSIKTYLSRDKAISAFNSSWNTEYDDDYYKAIEVTESIYTESEVDNGI